MRKTLTALCLTVAAALATTTPASANDGQPGTNRPYAHTFAAPTTWGILGDSITAGTGATNPDTQGYAALTGFAYEGRPGSCLVTPDCYWDKFVDTFAAELDDMPRVRTVIVEIGINDLNVDRGVTHKQIEAGLASVRAAGKARGVNVVLTTLTPWARTHIGPDFGQVHAQSLGARTRVNTWIRASGYPYIDFAKTLENRNGYLAAPYSYDGLHPNDAGHARLAEVVMAYMKRHR